MNELIFALLHKYAEEMNPTQHTRGDIQEFTNYLLVCAAGIRSASHCVLACICKKNYCQNADPDFRQVMWFNFYAWAHVHRLDLGKRIPQINLSIPYEVKEINLDGVIYPILLLKEEVKK